MEPERCPCGAACWCDGLCGSCGLPEGTTAHQYAAVLRHAYPPPGRLPFPPAGCRYTDGATSERIDQALRAAGWTGLRLDELLHLTGLAYDQAYPLVERGLEGRRLQARQLPAKTSQGERVPGGTRYALR